MSGRALPDGADPNDFWAYFGVADELDGGLSLEDLDARFIADAKRGAETFRLSWPPYLPEAEEYALDHRTALQVSR